MTLDNIKTSFTRRDINDSTIQFMVLSERFDYRPYTYCCSVYGLIQDWWSDCNFCPENDAVLLMATLYNKGNAYPIKYIGLNEEYRTPEEMLNIANYVFQKENLTTKDKNYVKEVGDRIRYFINYKFNSKVKQCEE